ncbi:MAG: 3-dehydroquinate synthase [Firmicutes bacterium]|nr:3-dehydroquinate synthase [Bacillota bacterium]
MEKINLKTKTRDYNIYVGENLLDNVLQYIDITFDKVFIVTDETVAKLYLEKLKANFKGREVFCHILRPGEDAKNLDTVNKIYDYFIENKISKSDLIIGFGGGVVGDITGFAAATILRGVNIVQIPTTVLAMIDSSIGGKCGVNLKSGKNLAGTIYQPRNVLCDIALFKSLKKSEIANGLSEAIKYGFIKNPQILKSVEEADLHNTILNSIKVKKEIVEADEFEDNVRMLLNFGHTYGHAIEKLGEYKMFSHGQAVSLGMVLALKLGIKLKITKPENLETLIQLLNRLNLPAVCPFTAEEMYKYISADKKVRNDKVHFVFIEDIGIAKIIPIALSDLKGINL